MQVVPNSLPAVKFEDEDRFAQVELSGKLSEDFGSKLKMDGAEEEERRNREKSLLERAESDGDREEEEETDDDDDDDDEFSFVCLNPDGSPIAAEEAFQDGQIRPVYPLFNRDLLFAGETRPNDGAATATSVNGPALRSPLKKLFVEDRGGGDAATTSDSEPQGPYCSWSGRVSDASPETCKKSNSTGFSKIWRFRDLVLRSNSDGKDAFVFLNNNGGSNVKSEASSAATAKQGLEKDKKKTKEERTKKGKDETTSSSAHERLYVKNRAMRDEGKRKSYLPYKQVGFFANVNGLSRNIHPF